MLYLPPGGQPFRFTTCVSPWLCLTERNRPPRSPASLAHTILRAEYRSAEHASMIADLGIADLVYVLRERFEVQIGVQAAN